MPIPTLEQVEESGGNMDSITEFIKSGAPSFVDQYGKTRATLTGATDKIDADVAEVDSAKDQALTDIAAYVAEVEAEAAVAIPQVIADNQVLFDSQYSDNQETFDTQISQQQTDFDNTQAAAIAAAGYEVIGNFTDGCTVTKLSDAVYYAGDPLDSNANEGFYAWNGAFPKTVTAGSTPFDEQGWQLAATGYTKQSGTIQLFGQTIDADIAIPAGQNALSINPTVSDGVTVTVPVGSEYVILGSTI